ncbi:hypothetical protein AAVH_31703, partial [Aphelenchoides avenae]
NDAKCVFAGVCELSTRRVTDVTKSLRESGCDLPFEYNTGSNTYCIAGVCKNRSGPVPDHWEPAGISEI